ncbi:MAG: class I SAM-dependent methyltransferase [Candidatus Omnitrophica bacterium]|nr:class I SAM-dependent methyltransferase [Candidatus Omnitrophota bacterium]MDE2223065.1 class I SAM-dependent methyltransferase [Candidatus Omnitrophota bacterium]
MGSVNENRDFWSNYQWPAEGEEWSSDWGNSSLEWFFEIYPRIHRYLPANTILEIAPGHGRWTEFLLKYCKKLVVVDVSENCINICKKRFSSCRHIDYYVNDGRSLDMVADDSLDFIFSFDSLVHAEQDVIQSYVHQLGRKLKKGGWGFIHHSNAQRYKTYFMLINMLTKMTNINLKKMMDFVGIDAFDHWRAYSMSHYKFQQFAAEAGLYCVSQELINWKNRRLTDCLSIFCKNSDQGAILCKVFKNHRFWGHVGYLKTLCKLYG